MGEGGGRYDTKFKPDSTSAFSRLLFNPWRWGLNQAVCKKSSHSQLSLRAGTHIPRRVSVLPFSSVNFVPNFPVYTLYPQPFTTKATTLDPVLLLEPKKSEAWQGPGHPNPKRPDPPPPELGPTNTKFWGPEPRGKEQPQPKPKPNQKLGGNHFALGPQPKAFCIMHPPTFAPTMGDMGVFALVFLFSKKGRHQPLCHHHHHIFLFTKK